MKIDKKTFETKQLYKIFEIKGEVSMIKVEFPQLHPTQHNISVLSVTKSLPHRHRQKIRKPHLGCVMF